MLSSTTIAALGKYRIMTPEELTVAPKWQEMPPEMAKQMVSPSAWLRNWCLPLLSFVFIDSLFVRKEKE